MDLKEEAILGAGIADHWYYRAKARAMTRALRGVTAETALDVGAGSGFFSERLTETLGVRRVDCIDDSYPADEDTTLASGAVLRRRIRLDTAMAEVDLALLMDVLEHVDDDTALLRATADRVRSGGTLLVTVPAFAWLWSGHDDFLGHRRRYTLREAEALVRRAGLDVVAGHYVFGSVFPIAVAQRRLGRKHRGEPRSHLKRHHPVVNRVLDLACRAETPVQHLNRLAGLSVFVRCRRP